MLHVERAHLPDIIKLLPGAESPTILPLQGNPDKFALHAVCRESIFWETMERLQAAGASAILVPADRKDDGLIIEGLDRMKTFIWNDLDHAQRQQAVARPVQKDDEAVRASVDSIVQAVKIQGDAALHEYSLRFDKTNSMILRCRLRTLPRLSSR